MGLTKKDFEVYDKRLDKEGSYKSLGQGRWYNHEMYKEHLNKATIKPFKKTMWVIVTKDGRPTPYSMRLYKGTCIRAFTEAIGRTWPEAKKYGWKCEKVTVEITPFV